MWVHHYIWLKIVIFSACIEIVFPTLWATLWYQISYTSSASCFYIFTTLFLIVFVFLGIFVFSHISTDLYCVFFVCFFTLLCAVLNTHRVYKLKRCNFFLKLIYKFSVVQILHVSHSVVSWLFVTPWIAAHQLCLDSLWPHGLNPTRWDSLGKNSGVGCQFLLWGSSRPVVSIKFHLFLPFRYGKHLQVWVEK